MAIAQNEPVVTLKASPIKHHVVLVLETRHGDQLVARLARLDAIPTMPDGPLLRVVEFNPAGVRLTWSAIDRLRTKALRALDALAEKLEDSPMSCLDVTGAPRPTDVSAVALAANVAVEMPVILVEAVAPGLIGAWRGLLEEETARVNARAIRRRRPLVSETSEAAAMASLQRAHPGALLDSEQVGRMITGKPAHKSPKVPAARARKARKIYGIWDGANAYLYPAFQFGADGKPLPAAELLANALVSASPKAGWWFDAHDELDGLSPADAFAGDPGRVIALATQEACDDDAK